MTGTHLSASIEAALALLEKLIALRGEVEAANRSLKLLFGDAAPSVSLLADSVANEVEGLADAVLGDELATYFLHECQPLPGRRDWGGGKIITADGKEWPIRTVADLRAYITNRDAQS